MNFVSAFSFLTGFGCGYVLLECVYRFLNILGFFLIFGFCFKVLRFGWHVKSLMRFLCDSGGIPRIHLCFEKDPVPEVPEPTVDMGRGDPLKSPAQNPNSPTKKSSFKGKANSEDGSEYEREVVDVDEVFDVKALRRLVKMERRKANAAWSDLEKERTASGSSAEEAMAMILRLQNEKSSAEIQANQFRRMAEERLGYDQEVIEELQWVITQHENEKGLLEDQLGVYREELMLYVRDEEINDGDGDGGVDVDDYGNGDGGGGGGGDDDNYGDGAGDDNYGNGNGDSDGGGDDYGAGAGDDNYGNGNGDSDGGGDDYGAGADNYGNGNGDSDDGGGDDYGDGSFGGGRGGGDDPMDDRHSVHSSSETELQTEKQTF